MRIPALHAVFAMALATSACPADALVPSDLSLDLASAYAQPEPARSGEGVPAGASADGNSPQQGERTSGRETRFGRAGSQWWSIGPGVAHDFSDATDINLHGIYSLFLADGLEFGVEAAGWYFNQEGQDTGGVSGSMIFRWHFHHWDTQFKWTGADKDEAYRNTFFFDVGIGLLAGFDEVPDGGTGFNFLPRAGVGWTHALTEEESGSRLTIGVRWHHISNARISGDERNPARDALMLYAEIQFPF